MSQGEIKDPAENGKIKNQLWVDKYTSQKFFDLLTDEMTNRNVLTWLKTWDEIVFPSNPKVNLKMPQSMVKTYQHSASYIKPPTTNFVQ